MDKTSQPDLPSADSSSNRSDPRLDRIREALICEADSIRAAADRLNGNIHEAVELLLACTGRVVFTGMGKMGWIARKAASTFSSTGTPSLYLHPSEAAHGDLGIVTDQDVLMVLSNSGETEEVLQLLPYIRRLNVPVIALTGNESSTLAKHSQVMIDTAVEVEADPNAVAPTCSTTVALAMTDALAVALIHERGFTKEQFAIFHPGGHLGRKLLLTVNELMHIGDQVPRVGQNALLRDAIFAISKKGLGAALICDDAEQLLGIITDGDLRRAMQANENPLQNLVKEFMTFSPATIGEEALAAEALKQMEDREITVLPVVDATNRVIGILHLHDLVRAGLA